ncbi:MAG: TIR domain-containing protein [Defluviitaleaceae bacterium]|nr:TIR domain-containing protein [Defluviitaleaceae bacterium]
MEKIQTPHEIEKLHYDVFISYRHGGLDGFVAEKLHKMLETYRVPSAVAKRVGKKKLARVFRDREELPTSSNLSDSINYALENSDFLLLICSRRTCKSQWVMREVERFGELHGKDKIITLLIDGEPDESFPPGLRERKVGDEIIFVEPLAADIRANLDGRPVSKTRDKDWDKSLKLLRTEEKLRLLAPILGCPYDSLRRRHRRRLIQRTVACVSTVLTLAIAFGAFSTYQYLQIDKQMQLKLENESYVISEYSATALADGDRDTAILLALEALPKNLERPERPFVRTAERALANALGIYDVADTFKAHKAVTFPAPPTKAILSENGRYMAVVYPFSIAVVDTESGAILQTMPAVQSILADVQFLDSDTIVFSSVGGITAYDIAKGGYLWHDRQVTTIAVSGNKSRVAAVLRDGTGAVVYSSADGEILAEIDFGGRAMREPAENLLNPNDRLFALNHNGSTLAVSFADGSLIAFNTETKQEEVVYPASSATYFSGGFYENQLFFSMVTAELMGYELHIRNAMLGRVGEYVADSLIIPTIGSDGLYITNHNMVARVDAYTGEAEVVLSTGNRIEALAQSGDFFLVSESNGGYSFYKGYDLSAEVPSHRTYTSNSVSHFVDLGTTYALTASRDSRTVRILKRESAEPALFLYNVNERYSEVRANRDTGVIAFYSFMGLRLYDTRLSSGAAIEVAFPRPLEVLDTRYDKNTGNIAVIYEDVILLYSGTDGALLDEIENHGSTVLFDFDNPHANVITEADGQVMYAGAYVADGEVIGAGEVDGVRAFAVSDGNTCTIFTATGNAVPVAPRFEVAVSGRAEVYFTGGYVFVSPMHGDARAYTIDGRLVRTFDENAYMTETEMVGGYIVAGYISMNGERYSLWLAGEGLETHLALSGFMSEYGDLLIFDDGAGALYVRELYSTGRLVSEAQARLGVDGLRWGREFGFR